MLRFFKRLRTFLILPVFVAGAGMAIAANPVKQHNSNAVWFENWTGLSNAILIVSAPNGELTTVQADAGTPVFQLSGSDILDGIYRFELRAATEETVKIVNPQNNGRGDSQSDSMSKPYYLTGSFTVSRGVIVTPKDVSEDDSN